MFNKSLVFGLFAASLMIAPTAAFAGVNQSQNNVQTTEQNGVATNGSTNAQESNSINVQHQISNIQSRTHGYGYNYHRPVGRANQSQNSAQSTSQNGAADNGSTNAQTSKTVNHQTQGSRIHNRRGWW
jgi:hypothetical protein